MQPGETRLEHHIHTVFVVSVFLKMLDGLLEAAAGVVLFLNANAIAGFLETFVQNELLEDPHDLIALYAQHILPSLTANAGLFALAYLTSHGVIKMLLAGGLLREKAWAYPASMVVFSLFIVFQVYEYIKTYSPFLILLTILDLIIIALTWHEYNYFKKYKVFPD